MRRSTRGRRSRRSSGSTVASIARGAGREMAQRASGSCSRSSGSAPSTQPLPARVLGWPAAADRGRSCARAQPAADRLRRAGLGAGRLGAGADPQPAAVAPAGVRSHVRVHLARPVGDATDLHPDCGDVPRAVSSSSRTPSSIFERPRHPYTAVLMSAVPRMSADGANRATDRRRRRRALPDRPARRMRVPSALPALPRRGTATWIEPAARTDPVRLEPHGPLSLPARTLADERGWSCAKPSKPASPSGLTGRT